MADTDTGAPPKAVLVIASVLVFALAAAVVVFALTKNSSGGNDAANQPLALVSVPAPQAGSADCKNLITGVPATLTSNGKELSPRTLAEPAPPSTVAWGEPDPVVLRCGLERPPELTPSSQLRMVNKVQWLVVEQGGSATWYAVDRAVYVALTVPGNTGTGPLQAISDAISAKLPAKPLKF
ncbi:DUF3515 domain-containing protein [Amycolatopsis benzoatilytica]|uniref:DUF3515 domain-containing protein n=1 Tax=Amycolatopsis benzoatilytica TaxID=346045 RepID=UPI00037EE770|nr:DUF3515 domain-containing protein [Amycolatopsis benzoatilytica]